MYTEHFQLTQRPFSRVPSAAGCVMFPALKASYDRCCEGIEDAAGPVMIISPSGCGKSTLLALIEQRFGGHMTTVTLNCTSIASRQELIQSLLFELGLPYESANVGDLRLKLIDHLKSSEQCPDGLLLLVDEAHNLSTEVLEELRMITNLVCGGRHQIRLVLAGCRPLEEKLAWPQLESFNQRIDVRCYLQPMSRNETMFYALAQLQMCGRDGREILQPSALEKIHDISDGIPRVASQLCDHSLKLAWKQNLDSIDGTTVHKAWLDLQQLPEPAELASPLPATDDPNAGVVEFGSLDDSTEPESSPENPTDMSSELSDSPAHSASSAATTIEVDQGVQTRLDDLIREIDAMERPTEPETGIAASVDASSDTVSDLPDDTPPAEEVMPDASAVFGSSFEIEEDVVDVQSGLLADQNHVSSKMTSGDVSNLGADPMPEPFSTAPQSEEAANSPIVPESEPAATSEFVDHLTTTPDHLTTTPDDLTRSDDADMLIVGESTEAPGSPESPADDALPPQGQVIRMNYEDLFQQLRNDLPNSEA